MAGWIEVAGLISLTGVTIAFIVVRLRWAKLGKELFPGGLEPLEKLAVDPLRKFSVPSGLGARLFARSQQLLSNDTGPAALAGAEALRRVESIPGAAKTMEDLMVEALNTAEIQSTLLGSDGKYVYAVVIPNRHEHWHLLRRYATFTSGWRAHAEVLRSSLHDSQGAVGPFVGMVSLLFFLSLDGEQSRLYLSCADANSLLIPRTLAEESESKLAGVALTDIALDFSLAA